MKLLLSLNIEKERALDFVSHLKQMHIKKFENFQIEGALNKYMGYVESGIFRYYKTDTGGNEHTLWFSKSFPFIGDYHSFLKQTTSELTIQAMNDYDVILINHNQMIELFGMNMDTLKFRASFAERSMFGWRDIAFALHFNTAEERYLKLIENYPEIENEIPLKHNASSIGITAETLSRLRTKYKKNMPG